MANLKKANVKKVSDRAQKEREAKEKELAEEEAKKQAAIAKRKAYNKNAFDLMASLYGLICAILAFLFTQIGVFSIGAIILGFFGIQRNKDKKDKYFIISIIDVVIGAITLVWFVLYITGVFKIG